MKLTHLNLKWSIITLGLLAGCARFQPHPISPAQSAAALDARTLDNPAFKEFLEKNLRHQFGEWPPKSWDFETLTLAALYYHPSLEVARAQWQGTEGGIVTAAQMPNPTLTAAPGYSANPTGTTPWLPGVSFDLPIETMGKRGYRKARAQHLSESARLNIAVTAWQVRSNLRASLLDFVAARRRESLLQQQVSVQQQIVQSLQERFDAGAVSSSELGLVKIALARSQLDLADARRLSADARVRVADAIGVPVKALAGTELVYELSAGHPAAAELMSAEIRGWALQNRADILGALADYASSQSALQLEIAKQYPDIHIGPGYQFDEGDHKFTLALTAELPILNQNQGLIAEAEAHRVESAARFIAMQAKVIAEIDRAVASYRVTEENLVTLESLAATQKKQSEGVEAQVKAGAADRLDLLNSQIELGATALVELDGQVRVQQAFGALEDAVQRPIEAMASALQQHAQAMKENKK
ncbi:MAG: Outer rane efflux protein [Pedosphaera sp.]|nr:Outer rane efflux protein [Pedosphaera sp.]